MQGLLISEKKMQGLFVLVEPLDRYSKKIKHFFVDLVTTDNREVRILRRKPVYTLPPLWVFRSGLEHSSASLADTFVAMLGAYIR